MAPSRPTKGKTVKPRRCFRTNSLAINAMIAVLITATATSAAPGEDSSSAASGDEQKTFQLHVSSLGGGDDEAMNFGSGIRHRIFKRSITNVVYEPVTKPDCPYEKVMVTEDGKRLEGTHTGCLVPNKHCDIYNSNVTQEERETILKLHNELRSRVAQGKEAAGNPGPQPAAALMYELAWDDELAAVARDWAMQCLDAQQIGEPMPMNPHDCTDCRKAMNNGWMFVGQNVAWSASWSSDGSMKLESQWPKHVHGWYDEVKDFSREEASHFKGDQPGKPLIAHYTQVVWGSTSKIGCGAAYYNCRIRNAKDGQLYNGQCLKYVCNYGPGGNIRGMKLYEQPCAEASAYPGLCKIGTK